LFSIVTSMCCDDAYPVTLRVSALAGCDTEDVSDSMKMISANKQCLVTTIRSMERSVIPRQGGNTRRNIADIITTQWCQQ
ncbi:hypothetical protein Tco_1197203, partial [Tanacetum coccineum]